MYDQYRQQMAAKIQSLIQDEHKKILCVGDPLPSVKQAMIESEREFVQIEDTSWREIQRENPKLELDLPLKHFDLLIVHHALEQALDPERLLLELRKYVQPEGQVYMVVYNIGHISTIINLLTEGWSYKEDGALRQNHVRYFSNIALRKMMDLVGFEFLDEVVYQVQQLPVLTRQLSQVMKNPYLSILSFIMVGRKVNTFPFIDYEDDSEKEPPPKKKKTKKESKA